MPSNAVTVVTVEPRLTAVVAQTTTWEEFPSLWPQLLDEVYGVVRRSPDLTDQASWQNVMLYRDGTPTVEVGVLVSRPFAPEGRVIVSELPGGTVARSVHRGDYGQLGSTHDAVRAYVDAHSLKPAGPLWEIYGHSHPDQSKVETEVYWQLAVS